MLKLHKNEDGMVFVTVLIIIMAMMTLAVTVINMQLNQATVAEKEINRIRSEALSTGAIMYMVANGGPPSYSLGAQLDGVAFNTTFSVVNGTGPNTTNTVTITVNYN